MLTPVRELAFQIGEQFGALGGTELRSLVICGGRDTHTQTCRLATRPHVVVPEERIR